MIWIAAIGGGAALVVVASAVGFVVGRRTAHRRRRSPGAADGWADRRASERELIARDAELDVLRRRLKALDDENARLRAEVRQAGNLRVALDEALARLDVLRSAAAPPAATAASPAVRSDGPHPAGLPIKGNLETRLYHRPDSRHYAMVQADVWFADVESAEAAGFVFARASHARPLGLASALDADVSAIA